MNIVSRFLLMVSLIQALPAFGDSIHAAVEDLYRRRPYLRRQIEREQEEREVAQQQPPAVKPTVDRWQQLQYFVDFSAVGYVGYKTYTAYTQPNTNWFYAFYREHESRLPSAVKTTAEYTQLAVLGAYVSLEAIKAYACRTVALYTLCGVRYGIVVPVSYVLSFIS